MVNRKQLEILLSQSISGFHKPKIEYEQYQTPPRVAANLIHFANERGHISGKSVLDICSGTGILGIGAALLDGEVTVVEIDPDAINILKKNRDELGVELKVVNADIFDYKTDTNYDTVLINPPFGIQQKKYKDLDFLDKATSLGDYIFSIHDGSNANIEMLPKLVKDLGIEPLGYYLDQFELQNHYPWHVKDKKFHQVMILFSKSLH